MTSYPRIPALAVLRANGIRRKCFLLSEIFERRWRCRPNRVHLDAVMKWLCMAQDVHETGGISAGYHLLDDCWFNDYPETTGYIIPTFFDAFNVTNRLEYRTRAIRMAEWECEIQLAEGGVISGVYTEVNNVPAVFNTGQVILGWIRAYNETGDNRFLASARMASDWLCRIQDSDGAWRCCRSPLVRINPGTYDSRIAWSLVRVYQVTSESRYADAAVSNIKWVLRHQIKSGWFSNSGFDDSKYPLLHTIAYTIRGLMEVGVALGLREFIEKALHSAYALVRKQNHKGSLSGRFDCDWNPAATWSCIPGNGQMAVIWFRLWEILNERVFLDASRKMIQYLKTIQLMYSKEQNLRGSMKGSHPVYGDYSRWVLPNWSAKFFVDALVLHEKHKSD